jgi:predicted SnoaL-like aldol condensation-catalyzing enzyme
MIRILTYLCFVTTLQAACFSATAAPSNCANRNDAQMHVIAKNKQIARTVFEEILSKGRIEENENIYHADFVAHAPSRDSNRDEDRAATQGWRLVAPDLRMAVLRVVAECDYVTVHWSASGTNSGAGNGLPATGKALSGLWGMTIFRIQDGTIREEWTSFDQYALLSQLGLLPQP